MGEKKSRKGWHLGNRKGEGLNVERRIKVWVCVFLFVSEGQVSSVKKGKWREVKVKKSLFK